MSKIFNRDDIKAGYLLRCTDLRKEENGRRFNMTVVPGSVLADPGALVCCNPGHDWTPLANFTRADLIHANTYRVDEVWGYTTPARAMDNATEGRARLWRRVKQMTLEEVQKALGYPVKIVEEGKDDKPAGFKKSSMTAGMVVKLRDGSYRMVMPSESGLLLVSETVPVCGQGVGSMRYVKPVIDYADDLRTVVKTTDGAADIVQVWSRIQHGGHIADAFTTSVVHRKKVWERDEVKWMTLEEIQKALGYPVEIVSAVSKPTTTVTIDGEGISFKF